MNSLPQDVRIKLKSINAQIADKNSTQLLSYSQQLHKKKDSFHPKVYGLILDSIEKRSVEINKGADKLRECEMSQMIKRFKR